MKRPNAYAVVIGASRYREEVIPRTPYATPECRRGGCRDAGDAGRRSQEPSRASHGFDGDRTRSLPARPYDTLNKLPAKGTDGRKYPRDKADLAPGLTHFGKRVTPNLNHYNDRLIPVAA